MQIKFETKRLRSYDFSQLRYNRYGNLVIHWNWDVSHSKQYVWNVYGMEFGFDDWITDLLLILWDLLESFDVKHMHGLSTIKPNQTFI